MKTKELGLDWPFVSVVVVNYNGREYLADCLRSLARQDYPKHRIEVIVVDNNSSDRSVEFVRREFPWVHVLALKVNRGFTGGNNAGFELARGEWIALLNADAAANGDWLSEAVRTGEQDVDIGGVACRIVFKNDPTRLNSTGLELYRDGRAGDRDFGFCSLPPCGGGLGWRVHGNIQSKDTPHPIPPPQGGREKNGNEVFGGCGAGLLLRRTLIDELGGFDESLFLYYEDLDLAWRARRAGWQFVYCPSAQVRHVFGASVGVSSPFQTRFVERNRVLVNVRHAPIWLAVANGLGLFARLMRSVWRQKAAVAYLQALLELIVRLPLSVIERFSQGGADRLYRQWSRPAPR